MKFSVNCSKTNPPNLTFLGRVYALMVLLWGLIGLILLLIFAIPLFSLEGFILFILPAILGGIFGILAWNQEGFPYSRG
jgi:polyferredoxin